MAGIYTTTTLSDAWGLMGSRLYDPDHVRWPTDELTIHIQQALRTFNALTNHFRAGTTFQTTVNEAFYDLPTIAPSLRAQTYTVTQAVEQIAWQLMEPPPQGNTWVGTLQFNLTDILQALQQARDAFLLETGVVITHSLLSVPAPAGTGLVDLPEAIVNLRRLAWKTDDGIVTVLRREDTWGLTNYAVGWQTASASAPKAYSIGTQPPLIVQLAPVTTVAGTLDLLTIDRGAVPNLLDPTQSLGVPNDWAWVVIFGTLAQLLQRDGLALDPERAAYCESRWKHGIEMAKAAGVVLAARVSGSPRPLGSVSDADAYSTAWQMVSANPKRVITMGHTLVGLWPPPGVPSGGGSYTVTLDVVRNAPVPTVGSDVLQIGPELVNDILDYAQHLAVWKECGPGQVESSMALLNQFMALCGTSVQIGKASRPNDPAALDQTSQDQRVVAYESA